ncbi:MAG: cobalamin-binding protein [Anaerolineae bacterium]|nr:cobalamin-binding protein [Anaerolineae bacterium]
MKASYRTICWLLVAALLAMAVSACRPSQPTGVPAPTVETPAAATTSTAAPTLTPTSAPITIVDDANTEITLEAEPERIVSLVPSMTEILFALGLGDRVVGVTTFCDYPEEAKSKEKVGSFAEIDLEKVVGLSPDLVLGGSLHSQAVAPALRERGLTVALLEATDVETTLAQIETIGKLTGRTPEAQALVADIRARLDRVAEKVARVERRPRVFWELDAMLYTGGRDSFVDGLITLAGGDNVGRRLQGEWPQFNLEALIEADPEVIVLADHAFGETAEQVRARPGWNVITAVKEGRIIEVEDINLVSRPGPRVGEAVEYIARQLHPDLFAGE